MPKTISELRSMLFDMSDVRLARYAHFNMKLKKPELIDMLEYAGETIDHSMSYKRIVSTHRDAVIDSIIEMYTDCD